MVYTTNDGFNTSIQETGDLLNQPEGEIYHFLMCNNSISNSFQIHSFQLIELIIGNVCYDLCCDLFSDSESYFYQAFLFYHWKYSHMETLFLCFLKEFSQDKAICKFCHYTVLLYSNTFNEHIIKRWCVKVSMLCWSWTDDHSV